MNGTTKPAYLIPASEVMQSLRVRPDSGLTAAEVKRRRQQYGLNYIPRHKPRSPLLIFLDRFKDPLVIFLVIAAVISLAIGELADTVIIAVAIFLDATLSFIQVWRTERTLQRLREHVEQMATALRSGRLSRLPARELTVGDIIEIRAGQKVPADARLIKASGLRVQEAALTGESADVEKHPNPLKSRTPLGNRSNMLFMGTTVMNGQARAVVTSIGTHTEFGRIAQVLKTERSPISPLRRKLQRSGTWIAGIIVVLVAAIALVSLFTGETLADSSRTAITLIVSAIPEDLTIILTIALTVGVIRILRQKGVVRELSSGETLGAATVICTDKTGTLTRGQMQAQELDSLQGTVLTADGKIRHDVQKIALTGFALASDAHRVAADTAEYVGSATERTALAFVEQHGLLQQDLRQQWRERDAIPFDTRWKYRASLNDHPTNETRTLFVSGAPDILLERSSQVLDESLDPIHITDRHRAIYRQRLETVAAEGKRIIGIAVRRNMEQSDITHDDIHDLLFLGVLTITDPIRPEVRDAIHQTQAAGVAVKLVTGDFEVTARAIAREAGLTVTDDAIIDGTLLQDLSDKELARIIDDIVVFARVEPLDKQRIVRALQANGHVVAMTGDGVNDAVALNAADIGVAMGSGKDITKDVAKLVLLDDNFTTIVAAIREGRVIRDNVRKVIGFLLATNAAEVAIFIASLIMRLPLPLLPAQILWINLVTDGTSDIALSLEPEERNVMARPPEDPKASLISKYLVSQIIIAGLIMTAFAMSLYWYVYQYMGMSLEHARTITFCFVAVTALLSTWSYRSLWESIWRRGFIQNPWLFASAGFSFFLQVVAVYTPSLQSFFGTVPLPLHDWIVIVFLALIAVICIDVRKYIVPLPNGKHANVKAQSPNIKSSSNIKTLTAER